jgi:hypothetical protein
MLLDFRKRLCSNLERVRSLCRAIAMFSGEKKLLICVPWSGTTDNGPLHNVSFYSPPISNPVGCQFISSIWKLNTVVN